MEAHGWPFEAWLALAAACNYSMTTPIDGGKVVLLETLHAHLT